MSNETPRWTPPGWLNAWMRWMLRTPGLQRLVGKGTALITFKGRNSGRTYSTPISYIRKGDRVILTGHDTRQWWRSLAADPAPSIRLAGTGYTGRATATPATDNLDAFIEFLEAQPAVAKVSGVELDDEGHVNREQAAAAADHTVVVEIDLAGRSAIAG